MAVWLVLAFSLLVILPVSHSENPVVCVNNDNTCIEGVTVPATDADDAFEAFYGIPYAHPPTGILRFAVSKMRSSSVNAHG